MCLLYHLVIGVRRISWRYKLGSVPYLYLFDSVINGCSIPEPEQAD